MHEQQGSICKYAVFWKLDKFADRKKNYIGPKLLGAGALTMGFSPVRW